MLTDINRRQTGQCIKLEEKPCVVKYLEEFDQFVIGTYELAPTFQEAKEKLSASGEGDKLITQELWEKVNHRFGSLIVFGLSTSTNVDEQTTFREICRLACSEGGGVFDMSVEFNKPTESYTFYVAHSNGSIGVYEYYGLTTILEASATPIAVHDSEMLTCVDHIKLSTELPAPIAKEIVCIGDSRGFLTLITPDNGETCARLDVSKGSEIWQVKFLKIFSSACCLIIIAAENSSWYIYKFDLMTNELGLVYENSSQDFTAGVTCITLPRRIISTISDAKFDVIIGSYDETLKVFEVHLDAVDGKPCRVECKSKCIIRDGGIWRAKIIEQQQKQQCNSTTPTTKTLLIAAMYAGTYFINLHESDGLILEDTTPTRFNLAHEDGVSSSSVLSEKPLHYDIDVSLKSNTCCIADFNNYLCVFAKSPEKISSQ